MDADASGPVVERREDVSSGRAELRLDDRAHLGVRERLDAVLQLLQLDDDRVGDEVRARGGRLAELHERRAEALERAPDAHGHRAAGSAAARWKRLRTGAKRRRPVTSSALSRPSSTSTPTIWR